MASSSSLFSIFFFSLFILLQNPFFSNAKIHLKNTLFRSHLTSVLEPNFLQSAAKAPPTRYFEVTKPITLPKTKPCSYQVLHHDFASTYGKSPVLAEYKPPTDCPSQEFEKIVLEWRATCKGRQFDRIFGVWLGGVEILRSCTAEPKATGIVWTVEKDITRYNSVLMSNQTLAVYIGNIVDNTYTGVYHVNITIHFYPVGKKSGFQGVKSGKIEPGFGSRADLIMPISRNLPLNDGLWFLVENSTDVETKEFRIPSNVYRAVLEVYVSFHENDEFWYTNYPNDYISANNLTGVPGNGPFREVIISLDDNVVGAVWPFTVVYTGGINPLFWRPITGIGSFDLPTYDIEITPYLGTILDGNAHKFAFTVTNALNVWYIDANLHLWLDKKSGKTHGKLLKHTRLPRVASLVSKFSGPDGFFVTKVSRSITSSGWVKSSQGTIITKSSQGFNYHNSMMMGKDGNLQVVNQTIDFQGDVLFKTPSLGTKSFTSAQKFMTRMYTENVDKGNDSYASVSNVTLSIRDKRIEKPSHFELSSSHLKNVQDAQGYMLVKGNLVVSGLGSTQQVYHYNNDELCYSRSIGSSNYTILYDHEKTSRRHNSLPEWR